MAGTFTVTINMPTYGGSNAKLSEQVDVAYLLHQVAQQAASGVPSQAIILNGTSVGSYAWGAGMSNAGR
jgi:hypothetical protein